MEGESCSDSATNAAQAIPTVNIDDDSSTTSSLGHEDFFQKDLRKFVRESRAKVEEEKRKLAAAEKRAEARVASLADKRARLEVEGKQKEDALTLALQTLPRVLDREKVNDKRRDLRHKLHAIRKAKAAAAKAIEEKVAAAKTELDEKKRAWGDFITEYESRRDALENMGEADARDARVEQFRATEYLERSEKRPPKEGDTPEEIINFETDMNHLQHLRNIRQANQNLQDYYAAAREGASPAKARAPRLMPLKPIKRLRISAPKLTDPPAKKTRVVGANKLVWSEKKKAKIRNDAIDRAAASIAQYIHDWRSDEAEVEEEETVVRVDDTEEGRLAAEFVHESQLEDTLKPDTLKTASWTAKPPLSGLTGVALDPMVEPGAEAIHYVLQQQEMQLRVAHLHSLALAKALQGIADLKATIMSDVKKEEEAARTLRKANQAVQLASDPDLRQLPFKTVLQISLLFANTENVRKLSLYLFNFVPYVEKTYAQSLTAALLHADLQRIVYWSVGSEPGRFK